MGLKNLKITYLVLILILCAYLLFFSYLSIKRHKTFNSNTFDLGLLDNVFWNTFSGRPFYSSFYGWNNLPDNDYNMLGDHFALIFAVISPIYLFYKGAEVLLVFQSIILALSGFVIFKLALKKTKNGFLSLTLLAVFFLYPPLQYLNLFDFHTDCLFILFFLAAFYFLEVKKLKLCFLCLFLAVVCKGVFGFMGIMFGVYVFFKKKSRKFGIFIIIFFVVWQMLVFGVFIPVFRGEEELSYEYLGRYQKFGASFSEITYNIIRQPRKLLKELFRAGNITYLKQLIFPVAGLALFHGSVLMALPPFLYHFLSIAPSQQTIYNHHTSEFIPVIFIALVMVLSYVKKKININVRLLSNGKKNISYALAAVLMIFAVYSSYADSPLFWSKNYKSEIFKNRLADKTLEKIIPVISKEDSITTTNRYGVRFAHNLNVRYFMWEDFGKAEDYAAPYLIDYVKNRQKRFKNSPLVDTKYFLVNIKEYSDKRYINALEYVLNSGKYGVKIFKDDILLMEKNAPADKEKIKEIHRRLKYEE